MSEIGVIGAGAWGTALALQARRAGNEVSLWARGDAAAKEIATALEQGLAALKAKKK